MQLDFATIFASAAAGPAALWVHLTAAGTALLVGAPDGTRDLARLRLRVLPGSGQHGVIARLAWLYPFVTPWPVSRAARAAKTRRNTLPVRWPRTDLHLALDAKAALILRAPAGYQAPDCIWQLGRAAADGVAIGLDLAREREWGHVLVAGGSSSSRQSTALRLLTQAGTAGWGLVVLDHSALLGKQLYELAPAEARLHSARIDLHARRGNTRPGLLDVAPPSLDPAGQAAAMLIALETRLPSYLRFLEQLGLPAAAPGAAREIAPAGVTVLLLAHYRARLIGAAAPALPEVPALYSAWASPRGFGERLLRERVAWQEPDDDLHQALAAAGAAGEECSRRAAQLLDMAAGSLLTRDPADVQLYAGSLRARLAPAATSPLLRAAWAGMTSANVLLGGPPLVLGNLGYGDSGERGAARIYGLYLLALIESLALERALSTRPLRPIALAWEELAPAWRALKAADISRLGANLRAGAIHLIVLDQSWGGLDAAQAAALRAAVDNWVIGSLASTGSEFANELGELGVPGGFSLSALPAGHALARCQAATGEVLCTVITAAEEGSAAAWSTSTMLQPQASVPGRSTPSGAATGLAVGTAVVEGV